MIAPKHTTAGRRVGLVVGAGGYLGAAWLAGAIVALREETGFDATAAEMIVGTSGGATIASLCAVGAAPRTIASVFAKPLTDAWWRIGGVAVPLPGSPALALRALRHPRGRSGLALLSGWLPRGPFSTEPLKQSVRRFAPDGAWVHPGLRLVTCDYATGERVALQPDDGVPLADAVAASCAVPGVYQPVRIGEREFVDGALHSSSNLDLVAGTGLDLVICLMPGSRARRGCRRLAREEALVRESGAEVVTLEPTTYDRAAMGRNPLGRRHRAEVARVAVETTARQLRYGRLREALDAGEMAAPRLAAGA